jgi:hypothetical protein
MSEPGIYLKSFQSGRETIYGIYCTRNLTEEHMLSIPEPSAIDVMKKDEDSPLGGSVSSSQKKSPIR